MPNVTNQPTPTKSASHNDDLPHQNSPSLNHRPITSHNATNQPITSNNTNQPIAAQRHISSQSVTHNQVTCQSPAENIHNSIQSNNSQFGQQGNSQQQKPDLLQHDVAVSRNQAHSNSQPPQVRQSTGK